MPNGLDPSNNQCKYLYNNTVSKYGTNRSTCILAAFRPCKQKLLHSIVTAIKVNILRATGPVTNNQFLWSVSSQSVFI